jgi:hypothetical protein
MLAIKLTSNCGRVGDGGKFSYVSILRGEWLALTAFGESELEVRAILQRSNIEY